MANKQELNAADNGLAQADNPPMPSLSDVESLVSDNPFAGLDDEPSDEVLELGMDRGTELAYIMRPDLHGVYVMNRPEVRDAYEAAKYKVAKAGSGWLLRESAFGVNAKGELTYGDCVIMVITKKAFLDVMARQKARRDAEMRGRGGELRITKGVPPPPTDE